jgi:hypothetical protein
MCSNADTACLRWREQTACQACSQVVRVLSTCCVSVHGSRSTIDLLQLLHFRCGVLRKGLRIRFAAPTDRARSSDSFTERATWWFRLCQLKFRAANALRRT